MLETFLMSRLPIASVSQSNGHGRAESGHMPTGRQGNLIVTSSKTVSDAELRAMLIDEAKKQGKPYGLYFEDISSGFAVTTRRSPQAFQVIPLVVYRVYVDGRPDELVRGVSIVGTPQAALNSILATGDKQDVFNGICGAESGSIPVSAVAPAMLVSADRDSAPGAGHRSSTYPAAAQRFRHQHTVSERGELDPYAPLNTSQIKRVHGSSFCRANSVCHCFRLPMRRQRRILPRTIRSYVPCRLSSTANRPQLLLPGMQRPYFIEYRLDDFVYLRSRGQLWRSRARRRQATRGSCASPCASAATPPTPARNRGDGTVSIGADRQQSPGAIRHSLWIATDEAYKNALRAYSAKQAALKRFENAPTEKDFAPAKPVTHIGPLVPMDIDRAEWKRRIVDASGLYRLRSRGTCQCSECAVLQSSTLRAIAVNRYLVNTEGTVVRQGYQRAIPPTSR